MLHEYSPENHEVVFDIEAEDFTETGEFAALFRTLTGGDFRNLVADEGERVLPFLKIWERQILELRPDAPVASTMGMQKAFEAMPQLSGVVYLSNNIVVSEALFDTSKDRSEFLDSRTVNPRVVEHLPAVQGLTFSFPRIYEFFGYHNSWGFIRFPRQNDEGKDAGVLISCSTLDQRVMRVMQDHGFGHLAHLYNRVWDNAVHDYLHNVILYTSPSFGIGKRSPLSLSGCHEKIDAWGRDMMTQKHNYEYWAHRTHRQITKTLLTESDKQSILKNAIRYIESVFDLHAVLANQKHEDAINITSYLVSIYLWPLNILVDPQSGQLQELYDLIDAGPVDFDGSAPETIRAILLEGKISESEDRLARAVEKLRDGVDGISSFVEEASSPVELGIAGLLVEIGEDRWQNPTKSLRWSDFLRLTVCVAGYRGLYEGWRHNLPVLYRHQLVLPHEATIAFLERLDETFVEFGGANVGTYKLQGIVA